MIIIATIIAPLWMEEHLKERLTAPTSPIAFGARVITEPRLPNDVVLTSGKALVHGSAEYEALLADALTGADGASARIKKLGQAQSAEALDVDEDGRMALDAGCGADVGGAYRAGEVNDAQHIAV